MDEHYADMYLKRIGAERPDHADADSLRYLQERHVLSVPFETVAFYTGEPVSLSMGAVKKVVDARRGGCCAELNSAFGLLLCALGFEVEYLWGLIFRDGVPDKRVGHMVLRVTTDDASWLVDVGHGNNSRHPLRLDSREPQHDPHGTYLLANAPHEDIDVSVDGTLLYRVEIRARDVEYGEQALWWYQTSPKSPFAKRPMAIMPTETGKHTLLDDKMITEERGKQSERWLGEETELLAAYRDYFGIALDEVPRAWEGRNAELSRIAQD